MPLPPIASDTSEDNLQELSNSLRMDAICRTHHQADAATALILAATQIMVAQFGERLTVSLLADSVAEASRVVTLERLN